MRRFWIWETLGTTTFGTIVALSGSVAILNAQENQRSNSQQSGQQSQQGQSNQQGKDQQGKDKQGQSGDNEIRLKYDDDKSRLSIDVDEEIDFEEGSKRREVLRDGEFDLRYDTDKNYLRTSGEGTVDMNRAASQMGRWWQSWWDDERQVRRGRVEGAVVGAGEFIRQYDDNDDQSLTRRELPPHMRNDFDELDQDGNNYLTRLELSKYGEIYFNQRNSTTGNASTRNFASNNSDSSDDRNWSEWWSSWWTDDQSGGSQQEVATGGSRQLIRTYDKNDDGYLAKTELPVRMREDFEYVDRNNDGYISRKEVQQYGYALRNQRSSYGSTNSNRSNSYSSTQSSSQSSNDDDQTWSQWWSSWWSDDSDGQSNQEIASSGTSRFIRQNDDNDDGVIVRSEMPRGMYDEFQRIDTNDDRRLTRQEIASYASQTGERLANRSRQQNGSQQSRSQQSGSQQSSMSQSDSTRQSGQQESDPMSTAYVWVIDANHGHMDRKDLQKAYSVLSKLDTNSDGEISQNELEQGREEVMSEWCDTCFDALDNDNDNRLTRSEAEDSMFANSFDQYDRNDDNQLTRSEAKQGVQRQLESQSASRVQAGESNRR